jgi:hypothetical protein
MFTRNKHFWLFGLMVFAAVMAVALALAAYTGKTTASADADAALNPTLRSLVVVQLGDQRPAMQPGFIQVDLIEGVIPATLATGIVRSDTDCTPDSAGVSHCRNMIEVGTSRLEIRHHHKMAEEPCFSPSEAVNILSVAGYAALQADQR